MDNDKYIGRLLDNRYEIQEVIGVGGMAVVYKARCHRLNRLVAIKILKDEFSKDEDFRRRFHAEGQAVAMLSHPNIVAVYDVSTTNEADYIVMELIDGITLKQYMEKKGVLNWKETLHFAIQISKGLEHAHGRGIVHRDIKPHNVMVLKNGSVKVADFGIARVMSKGNTLTKEALGSVHYISPEQAKGGRVDDRSDIYSLGTVMYEMMTGRPPYDGESPVAVAIQHINGGAKMPSVINPNIPGGLEQIIMKAMAHDPADRYASATAMLLDMDEFRKMPSILFDYNIPPTDAVTHMQSAGRQYAGGVSAAGAAAAGGVARRQSTADVAARRNRQQAAGGAAAASAARRQGTGSGLRRTPRSDAAAGAAAAARRQPARRESDYEEEENRSKIATIAVVACSVVAIIAIIIFLFALFGSGTSGNSNLVKVPTLVGKNYDTLQISDDFVLNPPEYLYDDKYEKGQIIRQTPDPGMQVDKGSVIRIWVSLGTEPQQKTMENLVGQERAVAENFLTGQELTYLVKEENSDAVTAGLVSRTVPEEGEVLTDGQTITLYISLGPVIEDRDMPNVVNQSKETAMTILNKQQLKLELDVQEESSDSVQEGNVIRTEPEAGEKLKTGDTVVIYVSTGPEKAKMPKLVGEDITTALKLLEVAGFSNVTYDEYVESDEPKDQVVEQSVESGEEVPINTEIVLKLSQGPAVESTKEVTFGLVEDMVEEYKVEIKNKADGTVVYSATVEAEVSQITIKLTDSGTQTYEVWIDDMYTGPYGDITVDFSAE